MIKRGENMFIDNNGTWKVKNTKTVTLKCSNCSNTAENFVLGAFTSAHVGLIFLPKRMHLGEKAYFLCCPICGNANKEISIEELKKLKTY